MVKKIILVGCGNIGRYHLLSLSKLNQCSISILEPSKENINQAKQFIGKEVLKSKSIHFYQNLDKIPESHFDLFIMATPSHQRGILIKKLRKHFSFSHLILEKLLASSLDDLNELESIIIKEKPTSMWVNCPRREFQFYQRIRQEFSFLSNPQKSSCSMRIKGGHWNMGSNAIHFIDLFHFLFPHILLSQSFGKIHKKIESRHSKYQELIGELIFKEGENQLTLQSSEESIPTTLEIETPEIIYKIKEGEMSYEKIFKQNQKTEKSHFKFFLQSELTQVYAQKIFSNKNLNLASIQESIKLHKLFWNYFSQRKIDIKLT